MATTKPSASDLIASMQVALTDVFTAKLETLKTEIVSSNDDKTNRLMDKMTELENVLMAIQGRLGSLETAMSSSPIGGTKKAIKTGTSAPAKKEVQFEAAAADVTESSSSSGGDLAVASSSDDSKKVSPPSATPKIANAMLYLKHLLIHDETARAKYMQIAKERKVLDMPAVVSKFNGSVQNQSDSYYSALNKELWKSLSKDEQAAIRAEFLAQPAKN